MTNIQSSGLGPGQRRLNGPQTTGREYRNLSQPTHAMAQDEDVAVAMRDAKSDETFPLGRGPRPVSTGKRGHVRRQEKVMTNTILIFPIITRSPLSCTWVETGNPNQPLACWVDRRLGKRDRRSREAGASASPGGERFLSAWSWTADLLRVE